ncbi:hypothetical protein K431DRAFT_240292 [Polychaeton citri CBS 116435]|uniref:Rsm22-domain-containing protein n=1 Tax=Polychaeton citri CBS 116435 TaxID=1314669 RepID=A0A9P4QCH5_9PEZI|nr:hypothetical protein K431DRAFT_240292 [Polychaeton citri CBS 116435]
MSTTHLGEAAHRIFGGVGLPYSAATPALARTMQPKPIALDAYQGRMSNIEGDSYLSVLYPAMYATTASILVETRKRLGTDWGENLVRKAQAGELRILDAGSGGAGVLAVREVLRAEWERMHEEQSSAESNTAVAEADGRVGGIGASPPLGHATVLTASDALRRRASQLLESTTFIPRLPDYVHTETAKDTGKFDIVIAPHTLWSLKEDYLRKVHVQNLWSLLSVDGGVLLMIEKGVPRGFELIAGAREMLLDTRIAPPGSKPTTNDVEWDDGAKEPLDDPVEPKDKGMIIAPCTNHETCPMYQRNGIRKGRKDICHFEQRYIRPPFLQKIIGARDKNHEDVKFSYLSIMRGRDLRRLADVDGQPDEQVLQDEDATLRAFAGYEDGAGNAAALGRAPHSLSLPRSIKPPLKRRGHVILDVCTPSGTLERWTVPKSFSRQAFRDARKSQWGDLWALGAKTRVSWAARSGTNMPKDEALDVEGHVKGEVPVVKGGQMRGRKVKGIRDKRDKKGNGTGRRKRQGGEI